MTFQELYRKVLKSKKDKTPLPENLTSQEQHQLDCLLRPEEHPIVWKMGDCDCEMAAAYLPVHLPLWKSKTGKSLSTRKTVLAAQSA